MKRILGIAACLLTFAGHGQNRKELRLNLNDNGSHYLKATLFNQVWVRYNESNPGSTVYGFNKDNTFDIGIRRLRFQLFGQLTDKVFFYTQFGQNNFSTNSPRFQGAFFHDAVVEYKVNDRNLSIGTGLTAWSGYLRFASPAVGGILGVDAPLYQQATNSTTDQFLRKLSIYAKGKISKLDYRVALTTPMAAQNSTTVIPAIGANSNFSMMPAKLQYQGYFMWQFLDEEANLTPYMNGTYSGAKRVFNLGAGFIQQDAATWHSTGTDTVSTALTLLGVDAFYDAPLNAEKGTAISAYVAYSSSYFGPNYLRMNNAMNPANGVAAGQGSLNGAGNNFPMLGTGNTIFVQVGYKFKKDLLPNTGTLSPYASVQHSNYKVLDDAMNVYEVGLNYLIHDTNGTKITLGLQNRPIFNTVNGVSSETTRKNQIVMQWQLAF